MCPPTQQSPNKLAGRAPSRDGCSHVRRGIPDTNRKYWRVLGSAVEGGTEAEDSTAVGWGTFREEGYAAIGVGGEEGWEGDEFGARGRVLERGGEGTDERGEEAQALNFPGMRVGGGKNGVEDRCKVENVDW